MKLQVASDLHIEMFYDEIDYNQFIKPTGDYLALVGDIGCPGKAKQYNRLKNLLEAYSPKFKHIYLLAGNHEYYVAGSMKDKPTVSQVDKILEDLCKSFENVTFLQKKSVLVEGVRIIGATLWSNIPIESKDEVQRCLNDYRQAFISDESKRKKRRVLRVTDTVELHKDHLSYILNEVNQARNNNESCVILTHHAPVMEGSSHPKHKNSSINSAFSSDLKSIIEGENFNHVKLWAYGHTHYNNSRVIGDTIVMANQSGYNFENNVGRAYQTDHCIEIE